MESRLWLCPQIKYYSDETAKEIDKEINRILDEQYIIAKNIIRENIDEIILIVKTLLVLETIVKNDIDFIHKHKQMPKSALKMLDEQESARKAIEGVDRSIVAFLNGGDDAVSSIFKDAFKTEEELKEEELAENNYDKIPDSLSTEIKDTNEKKSSSNNDDPQDNELDKSKSKESK